MLREKLSQLEVVCYYTFEFHWIPGEELDIGHSAATLNASDLSVLSLWFRNAGSRFNLRESFYD